MSVGNQVEMKANARLDNEVDDDDVDASFVVALTLGFRVSRSEVPVLSDLPAAFRVASDSESTLETFSDVGCDAFDVGK